MFTGIVEDIGVIEGIQKKENLYILSLRTTKSARDIRLGESVSVDGVCLTVTYSKDSLICFDLMKETLDTTTLGQMDRGAKVNLERALKAGGRFGGHIVTGHVDGLAKIKSIILLKNYVEFQVSIPSVLKKFIVPKGSICLNGISLTVGKVFKDYFSVYMIPFTMKETNMSVKKVGDALNIEADILARYILSSK
jgi:riboflavin synthase